MAAETLAPDALLEQIELAGALADIDDDPDAPDGAWLTATTNGSTAARAGFPVPSADPSAGAGLQEFRVLVRKNAAGGNTVSWSLELWENGAQVAVLATGTTDSTTGEVASGSWDATSLAAADGSLVECRIAQTGGAGGNPSNRRYLEVGAVEWNAEVAGVTAQFMSASGAGLAGLAQATVMARSLATTASATNGLASLVTLGRLLAGPAMASASLLKSVARGLAAAGSGAGAVARKTAKAASAAAGAAVALAGDILATQALTAPATAAAQLASAFTAGPGPAIPFLRRLLRAVLRRVVTG